MSEVNNKKTSDIEDDEICDLLKTVAEHFDKEDRMTRERQLRHWRRLKLYWNNFSQIYWSETAHDYRIYNRDINSTDTDQDYYDKPVNVFKAFLETIIAALSIQIPAINCVPDDADNTDDVATAKAGDEIAELIYKHNDVMFLWLHALYIYCTEGLIACYNYTESKEEYGTYDKPKMGEEEVESYVCPQCGSRIPDMLMEDDEFDPKDDDQQKECIECGAPIQNDLQKAKIKIPKLIGVTKEPKSRVCLDIYGGLYVKVANYAKKQEDTPYLIFSYETHYANALECYPEVRERLPQGGWSNTGVNDPYEQYARLNTQYRGEFPDENVTVKNCWLRPAAFNILPEDDCKRLKKKFKHGAKIVLINNIAASYSGESLDDHWTLTENPMSDYLNHDPLGELLTNIQDIVNDLVSLTLQTIEHGILQVWADPSVVNFAAQRQIEAMPGTITPVKPQAGGKNIGESFYSSKAAALSPEVMNFYRIIQELGQFVSGALPSIFGGQMNSGSSRTASEYNTSKSMALQRLTTPWRMITIWWKKVFGKSIPMFMKNMVEDERVVKKSDEGKFINVYIRKAETDGKIGSIELEPDDKMPVSDAQQADMIMQLLQLNNQELTGALMDPENLPYVAKVINIPQFKLPGEDDRDKQNEEIDELLQSQPIPPDPSSVAIYQQALAAQQSTPNHNTPPPQQPQPQPSVPIDVDVDNHALEAQICKEWAVSLAGRQAKKENPNGYQNVLLHMKAHLAEVAKNMQAQQLHEDQLKIAGVKDKKTSESPKGKPPAEKPKESEKMSGEANG